MTEDAGAMILSVTKVQRHGTPLMTYNGISGGYMVGESRIVSSAGRRR